jgi:hypothetical protein
MKKLFTLSACLFLMFSYTGYSQILQVERASEPVTFNYPKQEDGYWIQWDDDENTNGIGTGGAVIFAVASRWLPADLQDHDGKIITQIGFVPRHATATYTLKIWTGDIPPTEVYSQAVPTITNAEWNIVDLDNPYEIDASESLWFGYFVDTPGGHPAGCDSGPAVDGKGNMMYFNNEWQTLIELAPTLTYNWNLKAFLVDDDNGNGEEFPVTFNVNMAGAIADGDLVFDPEEHDVWIAGNFPQGEWDMPGSNPAFQLQPVTSKQTDTFFEDWDGYADFATNLTPWINIDVHGEATWGAEDFDWPGQYSAFGWMVMNPTATEPSINATHPAAVGTKYVFSAASNVTPALPEENKWLISPQMEVSAESVLSFYAKSITDAWGLERLKVYVSATGDAALESFEQISDGNFIEVPVDWTEYDFDLSEFAGNNIRFAVESVSNDAFMLFLDGFQVTNLAGDPVEPLIYTITLDLPAGDYEYKYFLVVDEPTWDHGEWAGTVNREISVTGPMEVNDIWGEEPTSIEEILAEQGLVVYPNPAVSNLNVASATLINEIRIFDISGRMVFSSVVGDFSAVINVASFNRGMYFMQVFGVNGVQTHKIQVMK